MLCIKMITGPEKGFRPLIILEIWDLKVREGQNGPKRTKMTKNDQNHTLSDWWGIKTPGILLILYKTVQTNIFIHYFQEILDL